MTSSRHATKAERKKRATGAAGPSRSASRPSSSSARARLPRTPTLPAEWHEFLSLLISSRVRFVIVGAHALAALGRPRNTLDLDVFVEPSAGNATRLGTAVRAFGLSALAERAQEFASGAKMTRIGHPPLRIDVMNHIDGVSFAAAWAGRKRARIDGLTVAFLGEAEFRRNKRAAGRPKDLLDLALLDERPSRRR